MILGKKIGMTQIFEDEKLIPVTVIEAGTNFVTQIKTEEKEGYNAITLAYGDKKEKNTTKPELGIFKKAGVTPKSFLKEFKVTNPADFALGQEIKVDVLEGIEFVDISGTSKGKKMAGRLGAEKVTVQNLQVIKYDVENSLLLVKGAVPGPKNGYLVIKKSVKKY